MYIAQYDTGHKLNVSDGRFGTPQVRKDQGNEKCTVLKSVVGTLDLSIRYLLHGETFPGVKFSLLVLTLPICICFRVSP